MTFPIAVVVPQPGQNFGINKSRLSHCVQHIESGLPALSIFGSNMCRCCKEVDAVHLVLAFQFINLGQCCNIIDIY